ncbi:unnamed protein product [Ectocarpus fasciculatus]
MLEGYERGRQGPDKLQPPPRASENRANRPLPRLAENSSTIVGSFRSISTKALGDGRVGYIFRNTVVDEVTAVGNGDR